MNYRINIQYDGTNYSGWQRQGNTSNTIQGKLERAISDLIHTEVEISGSGRTDAGVHAAGQTANFHIDHEVDCINFLKKLNRELPNDIAVMSIESVPERFHARLNAVRKTYRYSINSSVIPDVFHRRFEYMLKLPLDVEEMRIAASQFIGKHDFRAFSSVKTKKSTIREIYSVEIIQNQDHIDMFFTGDGFLYNMVRIIAGTLIEVGLGKRSSLQAIEALTTLNRADAGFTAPPQGLCLMSVEYDT